MEIIKEMKDVGKGNFSQQYSRDRVIVKRRIRGLSDLMTRDEDGTLTAEPISRRARQLWVNIWGRRHLNNKGVRKDPGSTK